jgi:transposase
MSPTASIPSWISNPSWQFNQHLCRKWDQWFESAFLQRRVLCEPDFVDEASATRWTSIVAAMDHHRLVKAGLGDPGISRCQR